MITHVNILDEPDLYESTTVEIMASGDDDFVKWLTDSYCGSYGNRGGYIPVSEIPTILHRADGRLTKRRQK